MDCAPVPPGDMDVAKISGGERRRVALCRLLLSRPDMLLLDEPTNHLDAESVAWLERYLKEYPGTVVAITHDRYFLDNVAGWILELDRGHGIPWEGNYSSWLEQKGERLARRRKTDLSRQRTLARELEWVRWRRAPGRPRARPAAGRTTRCSTSPSRSAQRRSRSPSHPGRGSATVVVEATTSARATGTGAHRGALVQAAAGRIVGVIGPNGAGKTTLFRMIVGQEKPDAGALRVGETVKLAYVDQSP
jgi:ATPase subunit of ABC transporter with duplicated ATPase domains